MPPYAAQVPAATTAQACGLFPFVAGGGTPTAGVVRDAAGNLYGTAASGGATNSGVVYRLDPAGCWRRIPGLPGLAFASADRLKL